MSGFIHETAAHYKGRKNIAGWDSWNELRWNVQAALLVARMSFS